MKTFIVEYSYWDQFSLFPYLQEVEATDETEASKKVKEMYPEAAIGYIKEKDLPE